MNEFYNCINAHVSIVVEGFSDTVRHGEEQNYLFGHTGNNSTDLSNFPESDALVFRRFITMFTNFAKTL